MSSKVVTEFANKSFSGQNYDNARPKYPSELYLRIKKSHESFVQSQNEKGNKQPDKPIFIDIGCGPGTATYELRKLVSQKAKIFGLDPSAKMIEAANELTDPTNASITFDISDERSFNNYFKSKDYSADVASNDKVTLITAAECSHWFQFPTFLKNSYDVLKEGNTGGKLFIFGYIKPVVWKYPELDNIIKKLDMDFEDGFGEYWEQPGRNYLNGLLSDEYFTDALKKSSFDSIKVERFYTRETREPFIDDDAHSYELKKSTTMKHFRDYVTSWSAYNKCKRDKGEQFADAIIDKNFNEMFDLVDGLSYDSQIDLVWATYIIEATCDPTV